ncbi:fluoride efflux transporter CrcB [Thiolapillus brandeum]|uniref:Fluoride-specific ion channel FluC n=1 Tax=Thiolapillus brandeum TaxID=1076588 RepID=A0A7U6JIG9_9GAMM|nr:fluoride efflux transporter CrcB [Thiolapillus brandeum]BAO44230.1 camphor resistance protein CrcB [Thiolapillus brandeum]
MMQTLAIAAGGATGALMRFWVSTATYAWLGRGFPWGTLMVNVLGSFAMGLLYILFIERLTAGPELRAFLLIGLLGAFTTFSTFSIETFNLIEEAQIGKALLNAGGSVMICIAAAWLGVIAGRQL